jgi:hypothetical protein
MSDSNYVSEREEITLNYLKGNVTNAEDDEAEDEELEENDKVSK